MRKSELSGKGYETTTTTIAAAADPIFKLEICLAERNTSKQAYIQVFFERQKYIGYGSMDQ